MNRLALPLVLAAALAACGSASEGRWPSLAMRAGEVQPLVQRPAVAPSAVPANPDAERASRDADARLSSLERDLATLTERVATQRAVTARASAAAQGQATDSTVGATAQVEISRGERLAAQAGDLRDRLDALAGELARQSVDGGDVSAALRRVGAAIARVEALQTR